VRVSAFPQKYKYEDEDEQEDGNCTNNTTGNGSFVCFGVG